MFLTDEEYEKIMEVAEGKVKDEILDELKSWANDEFGVVVFGYICDKTNGLTRLRIVLWNLNVEREFHDKEVFVNYDKVKQRMFAENFARIAAKYDKYPEYHNSDKIFVAYTTIKDEIEKRSLKKVRDEIDKVKELSPDILYVYDNQSCLYVVYQTDLQVERHKVDGLNKRVKEYIGEVIKSCDEYGVMPGYSVSGFLSQQMLERRYGGSIRNYFQ